MLLLCCDRQWTVRASTASPTRCPETRRWWWSTAMTKTQTCSRYCSEKTTTKKTLWNIFPSVPLCINSVSAYWLRVSISLSLQLQCVWPPPQLIKICDMGHNYISSLRHVLRYRVAYVCLFLRSGLRTRDQVIQLLANEKKSKNRNQQQRQNRNSLYKKEIKWDRCIFISVEVFIYRI